MRTDALFYLLFQSAPGILLELLGKPYGSDYQYQAVEVKEVAFRFDGVMRPAVESQERPTIFVEVQFQRDEYFYHRFCAEIFLFLRKNPEVKYWQAIVLFEQQNRETDKQQPFRTLLDSAQIQRLYLQDLQDTTFESLELSVLQLIVAKPEKAIEQAKQVIQRAKASETVSLSTSQILELIETIVVYKFPKLTREAVTRMLMIDELKQTRVYKDALEEGRQEGQCNLILKLLSIKLSQLDPNTVERIQQLRGKQLEALSDRLLDISTIEALDQFLSTIQSDQ